MANYKTTDYVIGIVGGLLTSINKPKYLNSSPESIPASVKEYIVINALPINADVIQKCYVNVNYHVTDIEPGKPDITKIEDGSNEVLAILKEVLTTAYLIEFDRQETIREDARDEHYSNLRFSFKNINN